MFNPLKTHLEKLKIVLATSSKQRHKIFKDAGFQFDVMIPDYDESNDRSKCNCHEDFVNYVKKTARGKVDAVSVSAADLEGGHPDIIIGLDTMVVLGNEFFGKPSNVKDALCTIRKLVNSQVPATVLTGVCIKYGSECVEFCESTSVTMRHLSEAQILGYVETDEPMGHAGSFAIQGIASSFIEKIDGDYNNVIGLPICAVTKQLEKLLLK